MAPGSQTPVAVQIPEPPRFQGGLRLGNTYPPRALKAARAREMPAETRRPDGPRDLWSGCVGIPSNGAKRKDFPAK